VQNPLSDSDINSQYESNIMNLNKVIIIGNLVRDAEKRVGASGVSYGVFTVATNHRYTDKRGERQEETAFVPCLTFGPSVEWLAGKKKGTQTIVSGWLRTESWEQAGTRKSRLILVCESVQFVRRAVGNVTLAATVNEHNGNTVGDNDIPF
jgi:single-strand DNA-binding protein